MKRSRGVFDNETLRDIGERLRRARGEATQEDFASKIGVGRTVLANYEAGRRLPARETLRKVSDLTGLSVNYLLTGFEAERDPLDIRVKYLPTLELKEGYAVSLFIFDKLRDKFSDRSEALRLMLWGGLLPNLAEHFQEVIGDNVVSKDIEYVEAVEEIIAELRQANSEDVLELVLGVNAMPK